MGKHGETATTPVAAAAKKKPVAPAKKAAVAASSPKSGAVSKKKTAAVVVVRDKRVKGKEREKRVIAHNDRLGAFGENRLTPKEIHHLTTLFGIRQVCGTLTELDSKGNKRTIEERLKPNVIRLIRGRVVDEVRSVVRYFPHYMRHLGTNTIRTKDVNNILKSFFNTTVAGAQDSDVTISKRKRGSQELAEESA